MTASETDPGGLEIHNSAGGEKAFSVSDRYLPSALPLSQGRIRRLHDCGLIRAPRIEGERTPIDHQALAVSYGKILDEAGFTNAAEFAKIRERAESGSAAC